MRHIEYFQVHERSRLQREYVDGCKHQSAVRVAVVNVLQYVSAGDGCLELDVHQERPGQLAV